MEQAKPKKVLLIDDDEEIFILFEKKFAQANYEILKATNGKECRDLIKQHQPDAFIFDIMLGAEDGTQLYNELVQEKLIHKKPVIFLTSLAEPEDESYARPGRKCALLSKAAGFHEILDQLNHLMTDPLVG